MKTRIFLLLFAVLLALPFASAVLCEERSDANQYCDVITPVVGCSGDAKVYNLNGSEYTYPMDVFSGNTYNFSINLTEGNYKIVLCNNATSDLIIQSALNTSMGRISFSLTSLGIVVMFIGFLVMFFWLSITNNDSVFRLIFLMFGFLFIPVNFGIINALSKSYGISQAVINVLEQLFTVSLILNAFIFLYVVIKIIKYWLEQAQEASNKKQTGQV